MKKYVNNPLETIENLRNGIVYLRKERFFKRDSANLFVAGLRAISFHEPKAGIEFGLSQINQIPDSRALRTLTTYMCKKRLQRGLELLSKSKSTQYTKELKEKILTLIHPTEVNTDETDVIPWAFQIEESTKIIKV